MCRNGPGRRSQRDIVCPGHCERRACGRDLPREVRGMEAIREKAALFVSLVDHLFGDTISDPVIAGNYFSVSWDTDIQMKGEERKTVSELCVYKTQGG